MSQRQVLSHPTRHLPPRLRHEAVVLFDERQYEQGFELLNDLLTQGGAIDARGGICPNAQQLALASTVSVHPHFTSRAKSVDELKASTKALVLLDNAVRVLGPTSSIISASLAFSTSASRRRGRKRTPTEAMLSDESESDSFVTKSVFAREKALFSGVEDFWQLIGWAFNCAVVHRERWQAWKPWLEWLLDLLERDWEERLATSTEQESPDPLLQSLLMTFVGSVHNSAHHRRILRAILANGEANALQEFPEVFQDETKSLKKKDISHEVRPALNLDEDQWGDYAENEDEDDLADDTECLDEPSTDAIPEPHSALGSADSIKLRILLMRLISDVARFFPEETLPLEESLDFFAEFIAPLDFATFVQVIANLSFHIEAHTALLSTLCIRFLKNRPANVDIYAMDQEILCKVFLTQPASAQNVTANAKLSVLLESLLFNMLDRGLLVADTKLSYAIEHGISARQNKAHPDGRKKDKGRIGPEQEILNELKMSSERLKCIIEILEIKSETTGSGQGCGPPTSSMSTLSSVPADMSDDDMTSLAS